MNEFETLRGNFSETILLENNFRCPASITITPLQKDNFNLKIEFEKLGFEDFKKVLELSRLKKSLKISSDSITRGKYSITHIVVTHYTAKSDFSMTWQCVSEYSKDRFYDLGGNRK